MVAYFVLLEKSAIKTEIPSQTSESTLILQMITFSL